MDENKAINDQIVKTEDLNTELNINVDSLVQEELKFSHTQPSKIKYERDGGRSADILPTAPKTKDELLQDVILSLAMEQRAIAQFIQAETKHMNAYMSVDRQQKVTQSDHHEFQAHLVRIVEGLVEKQKLSMRLLDMTRIMLKGD